jgi:predicted RNA-binding protein with PIN domain
MMPLLIDGHNLIGQMPDLDLQDPDDEAKLVARLRTYCARKRRRVTVVFDHGLPGGRSLPLSGGGVEVVFASAGRKADGILRERLRRARDPRVLTVVSSDREVLAAARARHVRVIRSEDFALQLSSPREVEDVEAEERDRPVSPGEVEEWLSLFGAEGKDRERDKQ